MQPRERLSLNESSAAGERDSRLQPQRTCSLWDRIDALVNSLPTRQQRALFSLGVLPSGPATFCEQAALALCDEDHFDLLDALVEQGLLLWRDSQVLTASPGLGLRPPAFEQ